VSHRIKKFRPWLTKIRDILRPEKTQAGTRDTGPEIRDVTGNTPLAGCTTGWVNYANEPSQAALEQSSQDAYDIIRLTRSKAAVWTVDDVARLIEI